VTSFTSLFPEKDCLIPVNPVSGTVIVSLIFSFSEEIFFGPLFKHPALTKAVQEKKELKH
jgi:hypothetical protein